MWANVYNRHEGREAAVLYCAPSKIVLQGEQLIDILRREVEARPELAHRPRCSLPRAPQRSGLLADRCVQDEAVGYEANGASMHGRARVGDSPPGQSGRPLRSLSRSCMKARNNPRRGRSPAVPVQTVAPPTRTGNEWSKTRITGSDRDRSDPTTRNADLQAWDRIARP